MSPGTRNAIRWMFHSYGKASRGGLVYQTMSFPTELPARRFLLVSGQDVPSPGVRSSFTANCSGFELQGQSWELVTGARFGRNVTHGLGRVATFLERERVLPRPGTLMSEVFDELTEPLGSEAPSYPHAVLVEPRAWKPLMQINARDDGFQFLQVLPLTTVEWDLARSRGLRALEAELERSGRDLFEVGRGSSGPPPIPDWARNPVENVPQST